MRDVPFVSHPLQDVRPASLRAIHVDRRRVAPRLEQSRDHGRLVDAQISCRLAEIRSSRGLDAVRALAEIHLVGVKREDFALGIALLDLNGDDRLFDLSFEADVADLEADRFGKQSARQLLGNRARAFGSRALTGDSIADRSEHVAGRRHDDVRHAQAEMLLELGVFSRDDRLSQLGGDGVVGNDFAPLNRELADDLSLRSVDSRDRARRIIVERRDLRHVSGIREDDPLAIPRSAAIRNSAMRPALRATFRTYVAIASILTPPSFYGSKEFGGCFDSNAMPERAEKVPAIVCDNHAGAGRACHLGNVRVVNASARGAIFDGGLQEPRSICRRKVVHRHAREHFFFEQPGAICGRQPKLRWQPSRHRIELQTAVPGRCG